MESCIFFIKSRHYDVRVTGHFAQGQFAHTQFAQKKEKYKKPNLTILT